MEILRIGSDFPDWVRGGALSIGNFDGVHRGHATLIKKLTAFAREVSGKAIVFTFEPHPVQLLRPEVAPPPLTWTERKAELLGELGVDALIAFPTDEALLAKTAREFFDEIIVESLQVKAMVEGPNFFFGRDRAGNVETLKSFCASEAIKLEIASPFVDGVNSNEASNNEANNNESAMISSSRIRDLIRDGNVAQASQMLTQPYRIRGIVTHGAARGAKIGFPTANLEGIDTLLPTHGIYAGNAFLPGEQKSYLAAIHVGPIPTFDDRTSKTEVHVLDYDGSLYGETVEVDFTRRLRDIVAFQNTDQLVEQLHRDIAAVRDGTDS